MRPLIDSNLGRERQHRVLRTVTPACPVLQGSSAEIRLLTAQQLAALLQSSTFRFGMRHANTDSSPGAVAVRGHRVGLTPRTAASWEPHMKRRLYLLSGSGGPEAV